MLNEIANYGSRFRIGMLLPSVNLVAEPQIAALLPRGVSLHTTRFKMPQGREADPQLFLRSIEEAARLLADAGVDLIVFHCTAISMRDRGEQRLEQFVQQASGCPTITTGQAVVEGLRALGIRKVVVLCPNPQPTYEDETAFLCAHGFEVVGGACMGILGGNRLANIEPREFYSFTMDHRVPEAEGYLLSCTAVRSAEVIEALERDLGCPVLTSNQAMLWYALRIGGVPDPIPHFGKLFEIVGSETEAAACPSRC